MKVAKTLRPPVTEVIFFRRAEDEERTLQAARSIFGHEGTTAPSFSLHFAPFGHTRSLPVVIPPVATGIMLTSRAALASLPETNLPVHCVGESTAQACRDAGFNVGVIGGGSAASLTEKLIQAGVQGVLCHPHGEVVNQAHYPRLEQAGVQVMPKCAYRVHKSKTLSINPLGQQGADRLPLWCVFSVAAALHLETLLAQNGYQGKRQAVALTPQVATHLRHWDEVLISPKPQLESLLNKVKTYLHEQENKQRNNTDDNAKV